LFSNGGRTSKWRAPTTLPFSRAMPQKTQFRD
jgi:hypothetical protein